MVSYTPAELRAFDHLTMRVSTPNSARNRFGRNIARIELNAFIKLHGLEKCNAMFEKLTGRKRKQ